jgi:D-glycero-D-manno-heptose 1,7-bisphosphate phosphatase
MKKAVFLDRDGVINESFVVDGIPQPPKSIADVVIIEGVSQGIELLKSHNFVPVVVTNQPDVARGSATRSQINEINSFIGKVAGIKYFYTCFHDDVDLCDCRKPAPGLLFRASEELELDLLNSYLIGDRWRDIAAGQAAGCKTFFIDYSYPEKSPEEPYIKVLSFLEAAQIILGD